MTNHWGATMPRKSALLFFQSIRKILLLMLVFQLSFYDGLMAYSETVFKELESSDTSSAISSDDQNQSKKVKSQPRENPMPEGVATVGGRASGDDNDAFVDVLAPVWGNDEGFLFLNPRGSFSDNSENEVNVGLGARKLILDENAIVGGNVFYDNRESSHGNRYNQLGLGLELLTTWVDGRINWYIPEDDENVIASRDETSVSQSSSSSTTLGDPYFDDHELKQDGVTTISTVTTRTTHHFDQFENAMEGVDFEIGVKLPFVDRIAETRVFGGYYFYNSNYRGNLDGCKARLEVRALPGMILDAEWFEDKELHGSDYYFGARMRLPFEIGNIFRGKNPFQGAREYLRRQPLQPLKTRMTDMVMRDIDVILEESEFREDISKLRIGCLRWCGAAPCAGWKRSSPKPVRANRNG